VTAQRRIGELGEDALVASVLSRYGVPPAAVLVGPGDDAAVLRVDGPVVASTDTLVEGYDFRRDWSDPVEIGVKVAAQNLADLAAMAARPLGLLVSLAAPADLPADWAAGLAEGLDRECRRAGAAVIGGDVSQAAEVVITGTALGVLDGPAVLRSGARPGDVVALAGGTGASAAGLALLSAGVLTAPDDPVLAGLLAAHRAPQPPYPAGPAGGRAGATAMIDTSDGLLRDAARLAAASGVRIDLDPRRLEPGDGLRHAASVLGTPRAAAEWVLSGGEDHALLACFPPDAALPDGFRPIGAVTGGEPSVLVGGRPWTGATGWTHFSG